MASKINIDRKQVRATYLATGSLTEAARIHGIKPATVRQWAKREEWETSATAEKLLAKVEKIQTLKRENKHPDAVTICHASDALEVSLETNKKAFVSSMAGSLSRAAKEIEESPLALDHSRRMVDLATAAKSVLGIGQESQGATIAVNVLSLSADSLHNIR